MKIVKIMPMLMILSVIGCGGTPEVKTTDLAVQAMERARVAEADTYAPDEYAFAEDLFNQMREALDNGDEERASVLAQSVIDAANRATERARQNKATTLIAELVKMLETAVDTGLNEEHPDIYAQATQHHIDAENYYQTPDYEKAIESAQSGIDLLNPIIGGAEALALANLNLARELLDRARQTTDLTKTEEMLTEASNIIEQATSEYQDALYPESIDSSNEAIDMLNEIMAQYPGDGAISIKMDPDAENLQLQAYDLIRRLGKTIDYIKENNYIQPVYKNTPEARYLPLTPAKKIQPDKGNMTNTSVSETEEYYEDEEEIEIFFYEEEYEDEEFMEVEIEESLFEEPFAYLTIQYKAQDMETVQRDPIVGNDSDMITLKMIEDLYESAQQYYNEENYLYAADQAREGLRLSELYLAGQTLTTHRVKRGDTLWDISKSIYKTPWYWPNIWRANKLKIKDPDLIYPKQEFKIPPVPIFQ